MNKISLNGTDWSFKGYVGEDWLLRNAHLPDARDKRGWQKASVPGTVQNDLWQAGTIPDPYFEMNSLQIEWVPERTWLYKKTFQVDSALRGQRIQLVFEGVDYSSRYFLNGELLGNHTGMFLPAAFEVSDKLNFNGDNLLTVVIDPAPFEQPQIGYTSQVYTQKARMNYWWDFCPRMVHVGIWQDVYLNVSGPARIEDLFARPSLSVDMLRAEIEVQLAVEGVAESGTAVELILRQAGTGEALDQKTITILSGQTEAVETFRLDQPRLWWPNGSGGQPLYEVEARLLVEQTVSDSRTAVFGIRRIEFKTNEGVAQGTLPYNLVVNGQKVYIRGWNWVPMDVMYGVEQPEKRERLLHMAQRANVNLLRVWGGGLIEKEAFYNLCDRLGILVWQEFIQSSSGIDNYPADNAQFIQFLTQNAAQAIRARRNHPSLAVWCGGNELHWSGTKLCDESHPALAALHSVVDRLDPGRHWIVTSSAGGVFSFGIPKNEEEARLMQDVHGPWEFQGLRKQYELYNQGRSLLHSEFGVEGLTNLRALNRTMRPERQQPVSLNNPVWEHLGAWWVKDSVWQEAFGPLPDVEITQRATQFIQADGLRYAVEADRRRAFANGGTMPWQYNEPYPMASCTSAVDYYAEPKPVYYAVARAYQALALSARFATLAWAGESQFEAEVWCANSGNELEGDLTARLVGLSGKVYHEARAKVTCKGNGSQVLETVRLPLDQISEELFFLDLALHSPASEQAVASRYLFSKGQNLSALVGRLPETRVEAQVQKDGDRWQVTLSNRGETAALWVWMESVKADLRSPDYAYFADNYFCLLPGEQRTVQVEWSGDPDRAVQVTGWNFAGVTVR